MKVKLSFDDARVKKDLQYSSVISASIGFPYLHPFFHPVPIHFLLMDSFPRLHNALLHNVTRAREREREREGERERERERVCARRKIIVNSRCSLGDIYPFE